MYQKEQEFGFENSFNTKLDRNRNLKKNLLKNFPCVDFSEF